MHFTANPNNDFFPLLQVALYGKYGLNFRYTVGLGYLGEASHYVLLKIAPLNREYNPDQEVIGDSAHLIGTNPTPYSGRRRFVIRATTLHIASTNDLPREPKYLGPLPAELVDTTLTMIKQNSTALAAQRHHGYVNLDQQFTSMSGKSLPDATLNTWLRMAKLNPKVWTQSTPV